MSVLTQLTRWGSAATFLSPVRNFASLGRRGQVIRAHLPITLLVLLAAAIVFIYHPDAAADPSFLAGCGLLLLLAAANLTIPWGRLPLGATWVIPLTDFAVIALLREGADGAVAGLGMLCALPAAWLAVTGVAPLLALLLSFAGTLAVMCLPLLGGTPTAAEFAGVLVLPAGILGVAAMSRALMQVLQANERELRARQADLETMHAKLVMALEDSRAQSTLLNTFMETAGVGLIAVDTSGAYLLMNRKQRQFYDVASPADAAGAAEDELPMFARDRTTALAPGQRPGRRASRGEVFTDELIWVGTGHAQRALSVSARPITDDDGALTGSVIASTDITALVNALAAKDDFVASVSHELRTPLTSVIGYLDLALDDAEVPAPTAASLRIALRNSERLLELVSELLSTASGKTSIEPEYLCLASIIRAALASAVPSADKAGITLIDEAPALLVATFDPHRMTQILDNLLSNAIKYSPGGGSVTVRAWRTDTSVIFQVVDQGMGISPEDQARLFTKFYRTDEVRRAAIPGVGLGLAITRSIVEAHGGSIECRSTPGEGSTFTVTLPKVPVDDRLLMAGRSLADLARD